MIGVWLLLGLFIVVTLYFVLEYSFLFPEPPGIPILMYHDLNAERVDFLTVSPQDFELQLQWLVENRYRSISMGDFILHLEGKLDRASLPEKPILITFDDGYKSNVDLALPILKRFDFRATLFLTSGFVEKRGAGVEREYLSLPELRRWVESGMEVALHSHEHPNYQDIKIQEVLEDLEKEEQCLKQWEIPYHRVLAYPFGSRPKDVEHFSSLKEAFARFGIRAAFRIGNRIQPYFRQGLDRFEVQRIDIRGDQKFFEFKIKVRKGRTKRF